MTNHVVVPGIVATLKAMMRRPELFGIPKPATRYALNVDDIWRETLPLYRHSEVVGRAHMFNWYGWDAGVRD